ncbi:MAG: hypothetical protein LBE35_09505 [Clostridiales bacterium]|nr:hypothetical protein [Clostridiales bacterium]
MDGLDSKRKVVLLKGGHDKWYEQAIFIMRAHIDEGEIDFIKEAERIINSQALHQGIAAKYEHHAAFSPVEPVRNPAPAAVAAQKGRQKPPPRPRTRFDFGLNLALVATGIALLFVFALNFM